MATSLRAAVVLIVLAGTGACGGGGGATLAPPPPGSVFNANVRNQEVVIDAISVAGNTIETNDGAGNVTIDSFSFNAPVSATVRLTFDGLQQLSAVVITGAHPGTGISVNRDFPANDIGCSNATCVADAPVMSAITIDPFHPSTNWNYQTFGLWAYERSTNETIFGAFSAGTPTPPTGIPLSGTAVFNGLTTGLYVDGVGTPFATASTMTANVDFSSRNIGFATSGINLVNANTGVETTRADLRLSGTLSYAAGVNSFGGNVTTAHANVNERLNGTASGRFYGPTAEEIGGVYTLSGSGTSRERMIGGFGGKK